MNIWFKLGLFAFLTVHHVVIGYFGSAKLNDWPVLKWAVVAATTASLVGMFWLLFIWLPNE
jgi:hypothetical protein